MELDLKGLLWWTIESRNKEKVSKRKNGRLGFGIILGFSGATKESRRKLTNMKTWTIGSKRNNTRKWQEGSSKE